MNKKFAIILVILFLILSLSVCMCPQITHFDRIIICELQKLLKPIPLTVPLLCDCALYSAMIAIPLILSLVLFVKKKKYFELLLFTSVPLITFILNCIIKPLVHRARPPYELQLSIHPGSYSYVSSHSLVTCCLWGMIIYYTLKYCKNKIIKNLICIISVIWILFVGVSRVWIGVHNPTDVLGAYILALILIFCFTKIGEKL